MYIEKTNLETILHSEQGLDLVDRNEWNSFIPSEEQPVNDTYRCKIAYLPADMTMEDCDVIFLEIEENE